MNETPLFMTEISQNPIVAAIVAHLPHDENSNENTPSAIRARALAGASVPMASDAPATEPEPYADDEGRECGRDSLASQTTDALRRRSVAPRGPQWTEFENLAALEAYFSSCEAVQESRAEDRCIHANNVYAHFVQELDRCGLWRPSATTHGVKTPAESVQVRRCHDVNELGETTAGCNPTVYERGKKVRGEVLKVGAVFRRAFRAAGGKFGSSGSAVHDFWRDTEKIASAEVSSCFTHVFRYVCPESPYLHEERLSDLRRRALKELSVHESERATTPENTAGRAYQRQAARACRAASIDPLSLQANPSPASMSREATFEQRTHDELKRTNDLIEAMFRYFSSGEVVHIPARDSQHTQAVAPPSASQHTECEIPSTAPKANAEQTNHGDGEECQALSADENDSAAAVDPNVPDSSTTMVDEAHGKRSRECTPEVASPARRSVRARQSPRRLL